ncbi:MAG TPA: thioredoxin domain-containing protein [Gemmatimonadaceae bacterium]
MPRTPFIVIVACIALASAACTRSEPATSRQTASGEVAPARGATGLSGLTDSVSARADKGRIRGAESAPIWLVEISDFQCPYCKQWHDDTYAGIDSEFVKTGKVRLAYLNYPIPSLHPNARVASEAAMCASVQGKFWALHESLFITQQSWASEKDPMPRLDSLATAAGVDAKNWRACMATHATVPLIDADIDRSRQAGVQSTPTFFVGDQKILGAYPLDTFRLAINTQLAKAKAKASH